jgi:polyisoprenoid-binding protein YceI
MTSSTQSAQIAGGVWTFDQVHSLIEFAARHNEIAYVKGRFPKFAGTIDIDEQDLLKSKVNLTIDAAAVDSQAAQGRLDLINGEDVLATSAHPEITFRSKNIQQQDLTHFVVTGDLSMRGVTREVAVPIDFNGIVNTRMGTIAGFSGNLVLKMSDFGVPFAREFEPGRRVVGDDIKIELQIEAKPQQPAS